MNPLGPGSPIYGYTDTNSLDELIPDIDGMVKTYESRSAPIMSYFSNPESGALFPTSQTTFYWFEDQWDEPDVTLLTALVDGAPNATQNVTINLSDAIIGQIIGHIQTGQSLEVVNLAAPIPNVSVVATVKRIPYTAGIEAIAADSMCKNFGIFIPEGGYYPPPSGHKPRKLQSNVGLKAVTCGITRTAKNSPEWYTSSQFDYDLKVKTLRFKRELERYYLFATPFEQMTTQNNLSGGGSWTNVMRSGTGMYQRVTTNTDLYVGQLDEDTLDDWFNTAVWGGIDNGSSDKILLWGPDAMTDIDKFAKNRYYIMPDTNFNGWLENYGLSVQAIVFRGGHRAYLTEEREFASPGDELRHTLFAVNMDSVRIRHKRPSFIEVYADTQPRNADRLEMAMVHEAGLEFSLEQFSARLGHI